MCKIAMTVFLCGHCDYTLDEPCDHCVYLAPRDRRWPKLPIRCPKIVWKDPQEHPVELAATEQEPCKKCKEAIKARLDNVCDPIINDLDECEGELKELKDRVVAILTASMAATKLMERAKDKPVGEDYRHWYNRALVPGFTDQLNLCVSAQKFIQKRLSTAAVVLNHELEAIEEERDEDFDGYVDRKKHTGTETRLDSMWANVKPALTKQVEDLELMAARIGLAGFNL